MEPSGVCIHTSRHYNGTQELAMPDSFSHFTSQLKTAYNNAGLSESAKRRRAIMRFAAHHSLIYFSSKKNGALHVPIVKGVTSSIDQTDTNICIGTHSGYDVIFLERFASISHPNHPSSRHHWHIMSFDLHSHGSFPFVFIGTRQQSRAFYANLFASKRDARLLEPAAYTTAKHFNAHYTIISSPAEQLILAQLLTAPITATMAKYQHPFAIEIQGDTLSVITDSRQTTESSLSKMMHYGLWLAEHIDTNIK